MSRRVIRIGDRVACVFDDHSQGGPSTVRFEVTGRLLADEDATEEYPARYKIGSWLHVNEMDALLDDRRESNEDWYWIVKSTIVSIKRLD